MALVRGAAMRPVESAEEALAGVKYVLVYFSAHWCPPCRTFTPALRRFYDRHSGAKSFEVVFVSRDKSESAMKAYVETAHGEWLAMSYTTAKTLGAQWLNEYAIASIPALLVFEKAEDGSRKLITRVGRDMVIHDEDAERFPWVDGEADLKRYHWGLLRNIIICVVIALIIGSLLLKCTFP